MKLHVAFYSGHDKISDGETTIEKFTEQGLELLNSHKEELKMSKDATLIGPIDGEWGKEAYFEIETEGDLISLDADFTIMSDGLDDKYDALGEYLAVFDFENNHSQSFCEGQYDTGTISHPDNDYDEYIAKAKATMGV